MGVKKTTVVTMHDGTRIVVKVHDGYRCDYVEMRMQTGSTQYHITVAELMKYGEEIEHELVMTRLAERYGCLG